ncbi:hypothetical protein ABZ454_36930 [Streptomyces sp. NPDC005803]|uniref:hypothetical protein n=1 Tax=Streptomyces sp. NPDC005803 TaxID=3154297 RepID=UPI0033DDB7FA
MVNQIGRMMDVVSRLPIADRATRDAFAEVDIAGYNYGPARCKRDVKAYPDRVIVGSETMPGDIARAWDLVTQYPSVIGDFIWVGWENLGGRGVGARPQDRAGQTVSLPHRRARSHRPDREAGLLAAPRAGGLGDTIRAGAKPCFGISARWSRLRTR